MAKVRDVLLWMASTAVPAPVARVVSISGGRRPVRRLLVLKLDRIGDYAVGLPACRRLRAAWPDAHITFVCGAWNAGLARESCLFDEVVEFDFYGRDGSGRRRRETERTAAFAELALGRYDLAVDLRYDDDTRHLLSAVSADCRVGYATKRRKLALDIVLPRFAEAVATHCGSELQAGSRLLLLAEAAILALAGEGTAPSAGSSETGPIILAPGASTAVKRWDGDRWSELARRLSRAFGRPAILLGGSEDIEPNSDIAMNILMRGGEVENLTAAMPLTEVRALIGSSALFIGLDSGLTHIAAEAGVPTVMVFSGHADPAVWLRRDPRVEGLRTEIACAPCGLNELRFCRASHACMTAITVDHVWAAVERLYPGIADERAGRQVSAA